MSNEPDISQTPSTRERPGTARARPVGLGATDDRAAQTAQQSADRCAENPSPVASPPSFIPANESAQERLARLNDKARRLPKEPGVYLMKDSQGRVIYIGKSASLRERVCGYFQPATRLEYKKSGLIDEVADFETLGTDSEVEALLVENRLVKDIQPKYNARLLDDKTFPYLVITMGEDFPGVYVTREPAEHRGAKIYGPFTSVHALREAVTHMQRAFKFRTCHLDIREEDDRRRYFRPCILHSINQCTAPCADRIGREQYREDIRRLLRFLDGDRTKMIAELSQEMNEASAELAFERAARLRDEIKALAALGKRAGKGEAQFWQPEAFVVDPKQGVEALQKSLAMPEAPRIIEGFDIAHLQGGEMVGSKVTFIDGVPFKDSYRRFRIRHQQGNNDVLSLQEVVSRRYRDAGEGNELYPDLILIDGGIGQLNAVMQVFEQMPVKPPRVIALSKQEELVHVPGRPEPLLLRRQHLGLKLLQYVRDEAHRFAQHYHHILRRKSQLEEDTKTGRRVPRRRKAGLEQAEAPLAGETPPIRYNARMSVVPSKRAGLTLQVFHSFAEADEATRREQWAMSVSERMQLVEQLRQVAYGYTEEEGEDAARTHQRLPRIIEVVPQASR